MDELTWLFADGSLGVRACAAGFQAFGQGIEIKRVDSFAADAVSLTSANSYTYEQEIEPDEATVAGMLVVHIVLQSSAELDPEGLTGTYGGLELTFEAAIVNGDPSWLLEAIAYVYIGDSEELANHDLSITLGNIVNPDVANGSIEVVFQSGLADTAPEFFEAGAIDAYATSLTIDPEPSDEDVIFGFVFTGAAQLEVGGDGTLTLEGNGYEAIGTTLGSTNALSAIGSFACDTSYNCDCDADPDARTLLDLRIDTLSVSGYAANALNPGPGIERMYNNFIKLAQEYVYSKVRAMNTKRTFTWLLQPGVRYYGLFDNTNCCTVRIDRYRIEGAWIQDLNNVWIPLTYGIDPVAYTLDRNFGWPTRYQVRQCVEVFPAPQAAYKLRIEAHFQLLPLIEDTDVTTIPSTPVLNYAIFLAKSHKGAKDATIYSAMADAQIEAMIQGRHVTRRYVPGTLDLPIPTPPRMITFDA